MKAWRIPAIGVTVMALALGATATACDGGGEELTLEEYFQELESLEAKNEERNVEIEEARDEALESQESEEDAVKAYQDFFAQALESMTAYADGIDGLNPPAEVREEHDRFVEGIRELLVAAEELKDKLGEAETEADTFELFLSDDFVAVAEEAAQPCMELLAIAAENGIDTDLNCE